MSDDRKNLHERLWASAEQLRANSSLKLNEMFEPILGLIFLKFADVRFKQATSLIEEDLAKISGRKPPITPEMYRQKGVPFIPEGAHYSSLLELSESKNIGKAVNTAMKLIEESNPDLTDTLPQEFTKLAKEQTDNNRILLTLLRSLNQIPENIKGDAFGEIYEFFLGRFALSEGNKGGEYFTPQPIVQLIVEIIEPYKGKILDPACGSGGMFVNSAQFVLKQGDGNRNVMEEVSIYGQEKSGSNVRVAKMNLAIHGLSGKIVEANSFYEDVHDCIGKFDYVIANPPFNVKGKDKNKQIVIDPARLENDPRYSYGLPLTGKNEISNANYLWMSMFANALSERGRAGFVMASGAGDAGHKEAKIRRDLIEDKIVDIIINVGSNMFLNSTLGCTLWFFDKAKKGTKRENQILFINAQDIFTVVDKAHNTWTDEQVSQISAIVKSFRGEKGSTKYQDIVGRCKVASLDEIRENKYSLNLGRYVEVVEEEVTDIDFKSTMADLEQQLSHLNKEAIQLTSQIDQVWSKLI
jgi:type I restriction enzyme M protein